MAAVFRVHLRESKHLAVGERTPEFVAQLLEIGNFIGIKGETLGDVVFFDILDINDRVGSFGDFEHILIESVINALEHLVISRVVAIHGSELLDSRDSAELHVLSNLNSVCAPRSNHLAPRSDKCAGNFLGFEVLSPAEQPFEFLYFLFRKRMVDFYRVNRSIARFEKIYHNKYSIGYKKCAKR